MLAVIGVSASLLGRAEAQAVEPGAAVDVVDLPPLPEVATSAEDTLLAAAGANEDLVTGAAKREQSLGNVASAVTVISGDRLRRMGARTVGEAIASAAGIYLVDDRLSTRVGIRGLQPAGDFNTRILVIIDGTTVTESWSHLSGVGYDLPVSIDEIERIEVIRGPVSSIYGTNAFFGIINIITRGPTADGRSWARATVGQISGVTVNGGFAKGTVDEQLRGVFSATYRRGERLDYDFGDVERRVARSDDVGVQLQLSMSGSYHGTFAQVRGYAFDRVLPFAPYESNLDRPYTQGNRQILLDVGHVLELGGAQLSGRLFGNFYQFDDKATDPESINGADTLYTLGTARTVGAEVQGRYQIYEQLGVTAGLEATYNDTTSRYRREQVPERNGGDLEFALAGLYVEADSAPTSWLGITAGVRLDQHSAYFNKAKLEDGISPRVAAFLTPVDNYGLKLLYAAGFRYPSTYEAKFNDGRDFIDNGALKPEKITSLEAIAWARPTPTTWLRASLFRWRAENIIKQEDLGDKLQFINAEEYESLGLEMEASYRDRRGWLAFAGATLIEARILPVETTKRPPGSPWWTVNAGLSSPKLMDLLHLSTELNLVGAMPTIECDDSPGRPYAGCDKRSRRTAVFAGWNAAIYLPPQNGFDLTLGVRNLLGRRQEVMAADDFNRPGSTADTVPGEGRELYVRIGHVLR